MQRIAVGGVGALVAAAAVVVWITFGPDREAGEVDRAPAVSSDPDASGRTVGPPLVFGRREPAAPVAPIGEAADAAPVEMPEAPETSQESRAIPGVNPMTGSGGGSPPSRASAEGPRAIPGVDGPAPSAPLPPEDLLPAGPSDVPDPGAPVEPTDLAGLEAQVAKLAEQQGPVDAKGADEWALRQVDPRSSPAEQQRQYAEAYNWFLANDAIAQARAKATAGPDALPTELKGKAETGKGFIPWLSPEDRKTLLEGILDDAQES
jgi:hypothetical protein